MKKEVAQLPLSNCTVKECISEMSKDILDYEAAPNET
jgi:hypothetical protein